MTDELTLREKVMHEIHGCAFDVNLYEAKDALDAICTILEDTGSPAHMRVAAELRELDDA